MSELFKTYPDAHSRKAAAAVSRSSFMVTTRILAAGNSFFSFHPASNPFRSGIPRSNRITSGLITGDNCSSSRPSEATPTISNSGSNSFLKASTTSASSASNRRA